MVGPELAGAELTGPEGAAAEGAGAEGASEARPTEAEAGAGAIIMRRPSRRRGVSRGGRRLFAFDRALGVRYVAGADEAGRGSLAGPLVAAAVLIDYGTLRPADVRVLSALNDSKQHSPEARETLYPLVLRVACRSAVVSRCARSIDRHGLHVTNLAALRDALLRVARPGSVCLSDGFPVADLGYEQRAVIEGDARSAAIAAASILAKVTRDRYMRRADGLHPGWEFATHVGYATPEHRAAIERQGVSPLHRLSFRSAAYQQLALG